MKRVAALLLLLTAMFLLPSPAAAARGPKTMMEMIRLVRGSGAVTIPPEWDGLYDTQDSTYDCLGNLTGTDSSIDTLCGGQVVLGDGTLDCTGSANATSVNVTCTATDFFDPCQITTTSNLRATRTGNTFFAVFTLTTEFSGPSDPCDLIPDSCDQMNSHGTRTGPAPSEYCATPARRATWGELKTLYR